MLTKVNLSFLLGIVIVVSFVTGSPQKLTFYQGANCTGENKEILDVQDNLNGTGMRNASSVHFLGLWKLTVYQDLGGGRLEGYSVIPSESNPPNGECINKTSMIGRTDDPDKFAFYYADRLGAADMALSQIIFYTEERFIGLRTAINQDSVAKVGPRPFAMGSYIHYSKDSWTVYPEQDFKGTPTHLRPSSDNVDGFTFKSNLRLIVGSAKKGLHDVPATSTSTTTSTSTGASSSSTDHNGAENIKATFQVIILSIVFVIATIVT